MGIIQDFENIFKPASVQADEAFVMNLVTQVKTGVTAVKSDINSAINWLVAQQPGISADVAAAEAFATAMGVIGNPAVAAAIEAANVALAALSALATSAATGATTLAELKAAYAAVKNALGLASTATAAAASA
jgi:hypothetical protein